MSNQPPPLSEAARLGGYRVIRTYVLYHAGCLDGFGAAWAVWYRFGDSATYIPVSYGEPLPEIESGSNVYILDFSYSREVLEELYTRSNSLAVIDHHATAKADLEGLHYAKFDTSHSGAILAWRFFAEGPPPRLLLHIQDRDLWQWNMHGSREINAALSLYDRDFRTWSELMNNVEMLREEGVVVSRHIAKLARSTAKHAWLTEVGVYVVPVVNSTVFQSEVGHAMLEQYPDALFVAVFRDEEHLRVWSLRSRPGFDCSTIAKMFGGGGHPQACGFEEPLPFASPSAK